MFAGIWTQTTWRNPELLYSLFSPFRPDKNNNYILVVYFWEWGESLYTQQCSRFPLGSGITLSRFRESYGMDYRYSNSGWPCAKQLPTVLLLQPHVDSFYTWLYCKTYSPHLVDPLNFLIDFLLPKMKLDILEQIMF